jgi:hypothetical protein
MKSCGNHSRHDVRDQAQRYGKEESAGIELRVSASSRAARLHERWILYTQQDNVTNNIMLVESFR